MEGLVAQGLMKWFKSRKVVDTVSLDIQRGEVVGLLGPNGAGKTTSFYMMVGLLPADGGRIFLEGNEITSLPMYQRCRMGVGYLPQESSVFRKLTVEENLLAILETLDLSHDERLDRLQVLLAELDLARRARHQPAVPAPRRAFHRCRPDRHRRHPGDRRPAQGTRHRGPDHRPQRPRDARDHGPRVYSPQRQDPGLGYGKRAGEQFHGARDLPRREILTLMRPPRAA